MVRKVAQDYYAANNVQKFAGVITFDTPNLGPYLFDFSDQVSVAAGQSLLAILFDSLGCNSIGDSLPCYIFGAPYTYLPSIVTLGLSNSSPAAQDMIPGSPFLTNLNGTAEKFTRVGITGDSGHWWLPMLYVGDRFLGQGSGPYLVDASWVVYGYFVEQEIQAIIEIAEGEGNPYYLDQVIQAADWLAYSTEFNFWYDGIISPPQNLDSDAVVDVNSQLYPDTPGELGPPTQIMVNDSWSHAGVTGSPADYNAIKNALLNQFSSYAIPLTSCTLSLSPGAGDDVPGAAGSSSISINTEGGCYWTAQANQPWVTLSSNHGASSATLTVNVTANPMTIARVATLTVRVNEATQSIMISQAGVCQYSLSVADVYFPASGGSNSIQVGTGPGCVWSASANGSWISIGASSGTGSGAFTLTAAANSGGAPEQGTVTAGGQIITVYLGSPGGSPGSASVVIAGGVQTGQQCYYYYGGENCVNIYNAGGVSVTINGDTHSGGGGDPSVTDADVANQIASGFNNDPGSPVTAVVSGGTIYFTAIGNGSDTDYPLSIGESWNTQNFSQPAFTGTPSGSTLTGGSD